MSTDRRSNGALIPPHVHIAVQCKDARSREQIAEWFGVPLELVQVWGAEVALRATSGT